jgi:hypothetical protein
MLFKWASSLGGDLKEVILYNEDYKLKHNSFNYQSQK